MEAAKSTEEFPTRMMFARLDSELTRQDYPPGRLCTRLVGVSPRSFDTSAFNNEETGCETYIIDVSAMDIARCFSNPWFKVVAACCRYDKSHRLMFRDFRSDFDAPSRWLRIEYSVTQEIAGSYAYPAFRAGQPTYLVIKKIEFVTGQVVAPYRRSNAVLNFAPSGVGTSKLTAFHVGQGMCSLYSNQTYGCLFDAGAGTPVTRRAYRKKRRSGSTAFRNDLPALVATLTKRIAIISHPDSDHWRLLEWDPGLLHMIEHVYLPEGEPFLAMKSPAILGKVRELGTSSFRLDSSSIAHVYRSAPCPITANTDALVATVEISGKRALLPGDYVYEAIRNETYKPLAVLMSQDYDAVMVPHHGDEASANLVPSCRVPGTSIAFFSAGNRSGYNHPRQSSIDAHEVEGFLTYQNPTLKDIVAVTLLP